jgi:hypothetical protein
MRRLLFYACLLLGVGAMGWGLTAAEPDVQRNVAAIRAAAEKLIASDSPDDVAKGAALLEKAAALEHEAANADKLAMELEKLKQELEESKHNHRWSEILVSYIPLATTMILAGTLIFQITQARIERRERQEERAAEAKEKEQQRMTEAEERAAEAARKEQQRYTDALKEIQSSEKVSTAGTLINTFMDGPYRSQILDKTLTLLLRRETMEDFQSLYMEVMNPLTYDLFPQMRRLYTAVDTAFFTIATPIWDESTFSNDLTKLSDKDRKLFNLYDQEQLFLSNKLAELLRTRPPEGVQVDLSQLNLRNMDLSGLDLGTANIAATNWNYVNLDGCDMSQVIQFDNCSMYSTAWWHAARISKPLLDWLAKGYPFSEKQRYSGNLPTGPEEYAICIAKLEVGGSEIGGSRPWGSRKTATGGGPAD